MTAINKITREDMLAFGREKTLDAYQKIATKSAIYPGQGGPLGLLYVALKGSGEAGEFAEHVGKALRDDYLVKDQWNDGEFTDVRFAKLRGHRHESLVKEVGDQLWYLAAKCNELGISLSEAAFVNLEKLAGRAERGTLQGSGDDR